MDALLRELFTTQVGLLSLLALVGIIATGAYIGIWVRRRIEEDVRKG